MKKQLMPREISGSLEDPNPSPEFLEVCWRKAREKYPLNVPVDRLKGGEVFSKPSVSGRDIAEALDVLFDAIGDEAFRTAALALRAYGLDEGGLKQEAQRLLLDHGGDPEWVVMPMIGRWVTSGLRPRAAARMIAAQYGISGPSFETVVKNLERTWGKYSRAIKADAPKKPFPSGDTGRKLKVRLIIGKLDPKASLKEIMGVAFDEDGFGVAPDTREWRRLINQGAFAFHGYAS